MNRLEQVLVANVNRQLTIPELCKAIGVGERSLRISCYTVLGMSPNQYLRLRRLNLLHIALLHADPATAKISVIAGGYGFSEFGRLAGSYRTIFGEAPSATLRHPRRKTEQNLQFGVNA
jgi:transcriptional regulator GlxA family with amidase domain